MDHQKIFILLNKTSHFWFVRQENGTLSMIINQMQIMM